MKEFRIGLILMLSCFAAFAQNDKAAVEQLLAEQVASLSNQGVETYLINWRYCNGRVEMISMPNGSLCISKGTYYEAYLIWERDSQVWLQKFDNCGAFQVVQMADGALFDYFQTHLEELMREEVKLYKSANYTGLPQQRKQVQPCFRTFVFTDGDRKGELHYNLYQMQTSEQEPNEHYAYNRALRVAELDDRIEAWIANNKTMFKRAP